MPITTSEIKRKVFHHLSLLYIGLYVLVPRFVALSVMLAALLIVSTVEFLRLRRPELNAWLLQKFGGIHRRHEIMQPSGIFWGLLGCTGVMLIFTNKNIVLP